MVNFCAVPQAKVFPHLEAWNTAFKEQLMLVNGFEDYMR
jgi:hypothetical protein